MTSPKEVPEGASTHRTFFAMDTVVRVVLYGSKSGEELLDLAQEEVLRLERLWSRFERESEISRINRMAKKNSTAKKKSPGRGIEVTRETEKLLHLALEVHKASGGAFDITIAPIMDRYGFGNKEYNPLLSFFSSSSFRSYRKRGARQWCGTQQGRGAPQGRGTRQGRAKGGLSLDREKHTVLLEAPGRALDLGGIGKGAAADLAADLVFREAGKRGCSVRGVLIDMGGNVLVRGKRRGRREQGESWRIGVRRPEGAASEICGYLDVSQGAVSTSAAYERWKHIMDPRRGKPAVSDLVSATVFAPTAAEADALSTAVFVLGKEKGTRLLEFWPSAGGVLITRKGKIFSLAEAAKKFQSHGPSN